MSTLSPTIQALRQASVGPTSPNDGPIPPVSSLSNFVRVRLPITATKSSFDASLDHFVDPNGDPTNSTNIPLDLAQSDALSTIPLSLYDP